MEKVRVGIVGLGRPGLAHANSVIRSGEGIIEAICDVNHMRRNGFQENFAEIFKFKPDKVRLFASYDDLVSDPAIEAIVVALPNALHYPFSLKALEHGKHVLCEKPPTMNAHQMKHLHQEAEKRGLIYFFGRQMRFSNASMAGRKIIAERRLGEIYFVETKWIRSRGTPTGIDGWFLDRARSGGGALIDIGVHAIDTAWFLLGVPRPHSVFAQTYQKFPQLVAAPIFDVEDSAYGMISFENGCSLQFQVAWASNLFPEIPRSNWADREIFQTTLFGPQGSLRLVDIDQCLPSEHLAPLQVVKDQGGKLVSVDVPLAEKEDNFIPQMRNFLRSIRSQEAPINSSIQALQLMEILDAIYSSGQSGHPVSFN
jgi:predicted dehydrogenase